MPVIIIEILIAAIISIVLGSLWYSPLMFGNQWMKLLGITPKQVAKAKKDPKMKKMMMKSYLLAFVSSLIMFFALSVTINVSHATTFFQGALVGIFVCIGFIANKENPLPREREGVFDYRDGDADGSIPPANQF